MYTQARTYRHDWPEDILKRIEKYIESYVINAFITRTSSSSYMNYKAEADDENGHTTHRCTINVQKYMNDPTMLLIYISINGVDWALRYEYQLTDRTLIPIERNVTKAAPPESRPIKASSRTMFVPVSERRKWVKDNVLFGDRVSLQKAATTLHVSTATIDKDIKEIARTSNVPYWAENIAVKIQYLTDPEGATLMHFYKCELDRRWIEEERVERIARDLKLKYLDVLETMVEEQARGQLNDGCYWNKRKPMAP